jgi:hypothetical protein
MAKENRDWGYDHSDPPGAAGGHRPLHGVLRGLVTYYVLFFIHLESRQMDIAGITVHPDEPWNGICQ